MSKVAGFLLSALFCFALFVLIALEREGES